MLFKKKKEEEIVEVKELELSPIERAINTCKEKEKRLLVVMGNSLISIRRPNYKNWLIKSIEENINILRIIEKDEVVCIYGRKRQEEIK